jgi:hypothetical protein
VGSHAAAKPARNSSKDQRDSAEERTTRNCLGCHLGRGYPLLLGLFDGLPVLLLVLGDLRARLINGYVLRLGVDPTITSAALMREQRRFH